VTDRSERWPAVKDAVSSRMRSLAMSQADLVRASGVSDTTVRPVMNGKPGNYRPESLRRISLALGWTAESIEEVLGGGEPTIARPTATAPQVDRLLDAVSELTDDEREQLIAIAETFRRKRG
jgi:transcriptional regulator with XRE-family HTH domain